MKVAKRTPALGSVDLWEFYEVSEGGLLPCNNARTLLYFMYSPRTTEISVSGLQSVGMPGMNIDVTGPVADDQSHMRVSYRIMPSEINHKDKGLSQGERAMIANQLAKFNGGKLSLTVYRILGLPGLAGK